MRAFASLFVSLLLVSLLGCQATNPVSGPQDSWHFEGTVTQAYDVGNMLQGAVSAGDIVNGNLRYSTTATDQNASPLFGTYEVGDMYLVKTDFGANPSGEFKLNIWNASEDRIRVRQNGTVAALNVSSVDLAAEGIDSMYLEIELEDENGNALSSDQLPPSLDLAAWTSKRFEINAYDGNTKRWYIVGTIGNIWKSN